MDFAEGYSVIRTFEPGRGPWGRWEVRDASGLLVGVVAEQPTTGRSAGRPSSFSVAHNPGPAPFNLRYPRYLRSRGAWWSVGHPSVGNAVASLARHLGRSGELPGRHYMTGTRR